jgi:CheY-like chemotaxis protein
MPPRPKICFYREFHFGKRSVQRYFWLPVQPGKPIKNAPFMVLDITNIFLADDDEDDHFMFLEVLKEIQAPTSLVTASDGEQLMEALHSLNGNLPDVLFLDLNMPRKNGFQCLVEIRQDEKFRALRTIIFSTSYEVEMIERLYQSGADHYIKKPTEFGELKVIIERVLGIIRTPLVKPSDERFVL